MYFYKITITLLKIFYQMSQIIFLPNKLHRTMRDAILFSNSNN